MLSLHEWIYNTENMFRVIKLLTSQFENVYLTEFSGKNYRIRITKNPQNNISLGYLFGLLEDQVRKI